MSLYEASSIGPRFAALATRPAVLHPTRPVAPAAQQAAARTDEAEALAAPQGVRAELWQVLTAEERTFFIEQAALGPLTYGPGSTPAAAPTAPRGQRLDLLA